MEHPFTVSIIRKATGMAAAVATALLVWLILWMYGGLGAGTAALYAVFYSLLLSAAGYLYWYILPFYERIYETAVIWIMVMAMSTGLPLIAFYGSQHLPVVIRDIPLLLVFGLMWWSILVLWYSSVKKAAERAEEVEEEQPVEKTDILETVSVKNGAKIHIIKTENIMYVRANGDYVTLHTDNGDHLKEQTMKYFEACLPENFVRIHRSCIVNSLFITRIELHGKESYNVWLHDGSCLRASAGGHKLLKEKLSL